MNCRTFIFLLFMIILAFSMAEIIEVSGDQSGVWENENTYQIIDDIHVNDGDTLIIEPGTTVMFMDCCLLVVYGIILAQGTEADSILFTFDLTNPDEDEWQNIQLHESQSSGSIFSHCIFEYAWAPVVCYENANILISNNTFRHGNVGVHVERSSPLIQNNHFDDFGKGIKVVEASSSVHILRNVFTNMRHDGIYCEDIVSCIIEDNTVLSAENKGIYCSRGEYEIKNNVIQGGYVGIHCRHLDALVSDNLVMNCNTGIYSASNDIPEFVSNTIVECKYGISMDDDNDTIEIINNIFYDNYVAMHLDLPLMYSFSNNLFWDNNADSEGDLLPGLGIITGINNNYTPCDTYGDLFLDPLFDDPELDYYTLNENSPAIDAGNPSPEYNDPDGTIADMGAYYYPQDYEIPRAFFTSDAYFGAPPLTVNFQSQSYGDIEDYLWEFGDGTTSIEENPVHEFSEAGEYDITLTVSGPNGTDTCQEENYIMVMPEIEVCGDLQGNWSSDFCYCITGNSSICQNATLTIEPGTLIRFMGQYTLTVTGTLIAEGTETDSIKFTSGNRHPFDGDWASITFNYGSAAASVFSHVIVEYAEVGIHLHYTPLNITDSRFSDNIFGIELVEADPVIESSVFTSNYEYGINIHGNSAGTIINNYFYKGEVDIFLYEENSPLITQNTFTQAEDRSVRSQGGNAEFSRNLFIDTTGGIIMTHSNLYIHHNVFVGVGEFGVYNFGSDNDPVIHNNTFCNLTYGIRTINSAEFPVINNLFYGNGFGIYTSSPVADVQYNLFYNNTIDHGGTPPEWFGIIDHTNANYDPCDLNYNLFMSPDFVNSQTNDFHLTVNSPCINAGNPDQFYTDPDGSISDIGALYYQLVVENEYDNIPVPPVSLTNYPNPFNPSTTIEFNIPDVGFCNLKIYNIKGELVKTLLSENLKSGKHTITWDGKDNKDHSVASGIYFYRLKTSDQLLTKRMLLLK